MYEAAVRSLQTAIDYIQPGVKASDVYHTLESVLADDGYDQYFPHHGGHGIGLNAHEPPLIIPGNDSSLMEGQVLAIEVGIYNDQLGGVRLEDVVHVVEDGAKRLTNLGYKW